ncbi:MAG: ABC transporter substrate-binding protein [Neomegalonema sp.]|nr:ABC transporter substrate-binding protein [Neomegalonema sp.]
MLTILKKTALAGLALATGLASGSAALAQDPESYKIGAILAMSGAANEYGRVMSQGINLAIEEINAKGGIDGIPLEAVIEDHKSGVAKEGVAALNRLINLENTQVVLTSFSGPTLAIAPIADEKKVLLLNGGGVSAALVGASKYLFHNRSLASDLGLAALRHAHGLGLKKMSQLVWKNDAGESIEEVANKYWGAMGGTIAATEYVEIGASNIDTQIAKIRASNPDFVALWLFSPEPGLALKRLREFRFTKPIIGIEFTPDTQKAAGDASDGFQYTSDYFTATEEYPWSKAFSDAYEAKYGEKPDFYAANYYENVYVAAEAIRRAKAQGGAYYRGDKLADAIKADPQFDSVYGGKMTYQENGVAKKKVALFSVKDGQAKFFRYVSAD